MTLVVALALFLLCDAWASSRLAKYDPNRGYWLIREKYEILNNLDQPVDWLILGDSACNQGVMPDVLERELGGRAVNLCTIGDALVVNDVWMLEQYLERFGPPAHVVLIHVWDVWHRDAKILRESLLGEIPAINSEMQRDFESELDWLTRVRVWISRYLVTYRRGSLIDDWIRHPLRATPNGFVLTDRGYMPWSEARPRTVRGNARSASRYARTHQATLSDDNRRALTRLAELSENHGFDVIIFPAPMYEGLWKSRHLRRYYRDTLAELTALFEDHARVLISSEPPMTFPDDMMENADHVTTKAAVRYSSGAASQFSALTGVEDAP